MRYLAIDIGASSGRHILGILEGGALHLEEIYRFPNAPKIKDGTLVWDVDSLFREILAGLKKAGELGKKPDCVGIDTWAVDYALLDDTDKRIGEAYCYRDDRTAGAIEALHKRLPFETLYQKTGTQFQPFNTVYQLYADRLSGKLDKAHGMLMLPDYFHFLLTGKKKQEYTNATSTGMVNAFTHVWDEEIVETLGCRRLLGTLSQSASEVGEFSKEIQEKVGYSAKVVLPATHDTASAVLAAPLFGQTPYLSSGTWSLLGVEQNAAHTDGESRRLNYSNEGSVNFTFRYQKNIMGLWMIQNVRREAGEEYTFERLAKMAEESPCTERVNVNDGRFLAPKNMTQEIWAAAGRKLSLGETAYCIFASLAESYALAVSEIERMAQKKFSTLNIIGGGCKNTLLNRLTALATGKKVITGPVEGTAIGNIVMQMIGGGEMKDVAEARKIIQKSFEIEEVTL